MMKIMMIMMMMLKMKMKFMLGCVLDLQYCFFLFDV